MGTRPVLRAAMAGLAYFAVAFAAGFALGVPRVLFVAPRLGETLAVMLELPIVLAVSWAACRRLIARLESATMTDRLVMGGLAFALLMAAEIAISTLGFGNSLAGHLQHYRELPGLLGLAGQIVFAALPIIQRRPVA